MVYFSGHKQLSSLKAAEKQIPNLEYLIFCPNARLGKTEATLPADKMSRK